MKYGWVVGIVAAVAACRGGNSGDVDAAVDGGGEIDAPVSPDAAPLADTDGDGVLDSVDLCPTVADPAQVDLDGDQIGWMCDSVESTTITFTGDIGPTTLAVRGNTFGAAIGYGCTNGSCSQLSFVVGPGGVSRAEGLTDAWLNGAPYYAFVSAENRVAWNLSDGVLGVQDASTDVFTPHLSGVKLAGNGEIVARYERDQLLVLASEPRESSIHSYDLISLQANGDPVSIATSSHAFVTPTIVGHNPARLVFAVSEPGNRSLRQFIAGSSASEPIVVDGTPLSNATAIQSIATGSITPAGVYGFCVEQAGKTYIVETFDDQVRGYEAPITSCGGVQHTKDLRLSMFSGEGGGFLILNGIIHPLGLSGALELHGTSVPAIITKYTPPTEEVYVVDETGAVLHAGAFEGLVSKVAREGSTVHFLSVREGQIWLVRYRNGTITQVPVTTLPTNELWDVFTTKEGAALVSTNTRAMVWPSQASVASQIDFDHMDVLVRGDATFFVASHNDPRSQPALYSYAEVGGVPQYTAHTPEVVQNVAFTMTLAPLGFHVPGPTDGLPTNDWFVHCKSGTCTLVSPMGAGSSVSLQTILPAISGAAIVGFTSTGKAVMAASWQLSFGALYMLDGTPLTKVLDAKTINLLYASSSSPVLLGWEGRDAVDGPYLCSAEHPDQCWSTPGEPRMWGPVPGQPDVHVIYTSTSAGMKLFTSIRTFGQGNRSQPLL